MLEVKVANDLGKGVQVKISTKGNLGEICADIVIVMSEIYNKLDDKQKETFDNIMKFTIDEKVYDKEKAQENIKKAEEKLKYEREKVEEQLKQEKGKFKKLLKELLDDFEELEE